MIPTLLLAVLPLIFVSPTSGTSDTLVVFVSGDGGWAAIDKGVSHVFAANGMPLHAAFGFEGVAELRETELAPLEAGPGVGICVQAVHLTQEITRQSARLLEASKGDKRAFGQHTAEVPQHSLERRIRACRRAHYFFFFL